MGKDVSARQCQDYGLEKEKEVRGSILSYLVASYLCSIQFDLKPSRCSSCNGGFSHFRCDLRKRAKALPLSERQNTEVQSRQVSVEMGRCYTRYVHNLSRHFAHLDRHKERSDYIAFIYNQRQV